MKPIPLYRSLLDQENDRHYPTLAVPTLAIPAGMAPPLPADPRALPHFPPWRIVHQSDFELLKTAPTPPLAPENLARLSPECLPPPPVRALAAPPDGNGRPPAKGKAPTPQLPIREWPLEDAEGKPVVFRGTRAEARRELARYQRNSRVLRGNGRPASEPPRVVPSDAAPGQVKLIPGAKAPTTPLRSTKSVKSVSSLRRKDAPHAVSNRRINR